MFCRRCGTQNEDNAYRCLQCGEMLHQEEVAAAAPPQQSGKAIASMVCSIAGVLMCFFVGQIIGLVLGYSARNEIQASQGRLTGEGFAKAGIIIGWIGIGFDALVLVIYVFFFVAAYSGM